MKLAFKSVLCIACKVTIFFCFIVTAPVSLLFLNTAKNNLILPNFLVWKFCGKAQFAIRPKLCGNCAFPQHFHTRKLGELTVFFTV